MFQITIFNRLADNPKNSCYSPQVCLSLMKHNINAKPYFFLVFLGISLSFAPKASAQQTQLSSGGNGSGIGGSFAYSVGQVMYTAESNSAISLSKGVQQSFELILVTGIEEEDRYGLAATVFPNPTTNYLTVEIKNYTPTTAFEILLFDAKGKQVHRQQVVDIETQIQMEHLSSALYILQLIQGNKLVKLVKVIKN